MHCTCHTNLKSLVTTSSAAAGASTIHQFLAQELQQFITCCESFNNQCINNCCRCLHKSWFGKIKPVCPLDLYVVLVVITLSMLYILKKPVPDDEDVDTCLVVSCIFSPKDFIEWVSCLLASSSLHINWSFIAHIIGIYTVGFTSSCDDVDFSFYFTKIQSFWVE